MMTPVNYRLLLTKRSNFCLRCSLQNKFQEKDQNGSIISKNIMLANLSKIEKYI